MSLSYLIDYQDMWPVVLMTCLAVGYTRGIFEALLSLMRNMNDNILSFQSAIVTVNNQVSTLQAQVQNWPSLPVSAPLACPAKEAVTCRSQAGSTTTTSLAARSSVGNSRETETVYVQAARNSTKLG